MLLQANSAELVVRLYYIISSFFNVFNLHIR